ncbi:MAG: R3H domain-containing nucleic acid-binding protein, partial [Desulfotignum sp.]
AFGQDTRLNTPDSPKKQDKDDDTVQTAASPAAAKEKSQKDVPKQPQPAPKTKPDHSETPPKAKTDSSKPRQKPRGKADEPRDRPKTSEAATETATDDRSLEQTQAETPPVLDVTPESIDLGKTTLQKMADLITEDAVVDAATDKDHLTLKISGGNAGILIGRKGQTLDAMQFLTDKIINRKSEARVRVKVDVEGYTETRKSNLRHLAIKMAEKAKKTGRPATINQMSAQDRRIVHLVLKDDNQVRTQSMGDGYYRRLVIFPKKKNSFAGKKRFKR